MNISNVFDLRNTKSSPSLRMEYMHILFKVCIIHITPTYLCIQAKKSTHSTEQILCHSPTPTLCHSGLSFFRGYAPNSIFNAFETFLNHSEAAACGYADIAGVLDRSVSRPLLEKTFHMKIQSRSVFVHRESFETILDKTEQMLMKVSKKLVAQRGARTHDPEIKSLMLYRLS